MKGQTQALTAVMITGVLVTAIASTVIWGVPWIEKRQAQADLENVENSAMELRSTIRQVSESGVGTTEEVTLDLDSGTVEVVPREDYIELTTFSQSSDYARGSWQLLSEGGKQGLSIGSGVAEKGQQSPGAVAVLDVTNSDEIIYRVEFRPLRTQQGGQRRMEKVDLEASGAREASGDVTITLSNEGDQLDQGSSGFELDSGETIPLSRTVIDVDLR